jgi:hypothetical protein
MKKIVATLLGTSLLAGALFANGEHMGDHMHNGVMTNHMNPNGMTNQQMERSQAFLKSKKVNNETTSQKQLKLLEKLYRGSDGG